MARALVAILGLFGFSFAALANQNDCGDHLKKVTGADEKQLVGSQESQALNHGDLAAYSFRIRLDDVAKVNPNGIAASI